MPGTAIFASNTSTLPITEIAVGRVESRAASSGCTSSTPCTACRSSRSSAERGRATRPSRPSSRSRRRSARRPSSSGTRPDSSSTGSSRRTSPRRCACVQEGCRIEDVDGGDDRVRHAGRPARAARRRRPRRRRQGRRGPAGRVPGADRRRAARRRSSAAGRLGRKNGKGFYDYDGREAPRAGARGVRGAARRARDESPLPAGVIEARLVLPMVNEAAFCLEDDVVADPARLDLAMIFGTGFPPFRGGLLRYADSLGLGRVFSRLDDLAERLGPRFAPVGPDPAPRQRRQGLLSGLAARPTREIDAMTRTPHGRRRRPRRVRSVPVVKSLFAGQIPEDTVFPYPGDRRRRARDRRRVPRLVPGFRARPRRPGAHRARAPHPARGDPRTRRARRVRHDDSRRRTAATGSRRRRTAASPRRSARTDASLGILIGGHQSIGMKGLLLYGTEEQKKKWLPGSRRAR